MKKILILTAGFGEGHNSAARGIRQGIARLAGREVQVQVHDLFSDTYGLANDCVREAYLGLINNVPQAWAATYRRLDRQRNFSRNFKVFFSVKKTLRRLLGEFEPDLIVSVYPAYPHMLDEMLGPVGHACGKRVIVITDSLSVNAIWYRCSANYYLLPNERSAAVLHAAGIPPEKTRTFGFPVSPEFAEVDVSRPAPSEENGRRVLYLINARKSGAPEMVHRLTGLTNIQLTVAVGRDRRLRKSIENIRAVAAQPFHLVGWSEELPRLLRASHVLISKAGGATVQEAMAASCPMIVNHIIPGQEEGNARLLVETGCGAIALTQDAVVKCVESVFANDAAIWREWNAQTTELSRPAAALETAKFLISLC
ncbi:MAG: galactosyldiacylglycerol synthase [Verrucomicrobiota bacterium]|nr:galactosyldiacylglycerol synthase [Verrucomicrobiota bacterium]